MQRGSDAADELSTCGSYFTDHFVRQDYYSDSQYYIVPQFRTLKNEANVLENLSYSFRSADTFSEFVSNLSDIVSLPEILYNEAMIK
jgi:hypothetical protein